MGSTVSIENSSTVVRARHWRDRPFSHAIVVYVLARVVTLLAVAIVELVTHHGLVHDLSRWDGKWFLEAVHHGWPRVLPRIHGHVRANPIAFFPLFPLLLRSLTFLTTVSSSVMGLVVSGVTGLTGVVAVGLLTKEFAGAQKAERAALLFAVSPGSFVFNLIYAEGLIVTFVALGLLALMRRRWWLAGLLGALATATSPVALAFVVSCVVSSFIAIRRHRQWRSLAAPLLAPLGIVAWMGYLWWHTGNLMAWRLTEHDGWKSQFSLMYPVHILAKFIGNPLSPTMTGQMLVAGTAISIVGLVVAFRERQPAPLLVYATSAVVLFACSEPVGLRPRFVMLAFPLVIAAATRWNGWRYRSIVALSTLLLVLMTIESLGSSAVFP